MINNGGGYGVGVELDSLDEARVRLMLESGDEGSDEDVVVNRSGFVPAEPPRAKWGDGDTVRETAFGEPHHKERERMEV